MNFIHHNLNKKYKMLSNWNFFVFYRKKSYNSKHTFIIFWNSWSMNFLKFIKCFQTGIFLFFIEKILKTQNIIFYSKILNFSNLNKKYHSPQIFENQCPWIFWNQCPTIFGNSWSMIFWKSMSHDFLKFIVQDFLEFNVPKIFATLAYLTG